MRVWDLKKTKVKVKMKVKVKVKVKMELGVREVQDGGSFEGRWNGW